jgi:CheY-like chemotaxis protein
MLLRVLGRAARAPQSLSGAPRSAQDPFADGEPMMNVLMVEDDADQVALWREALAPHGVRLRHAASREALEAEVAVDTPDVMLFDYWLEPYTGPQLVRMLRDLPEVAAIPKVCLTGDTGPVPRQAAMDAGFAAVLRKTVDPDDLVEVMRQLIAAAKRR